MSVHADLAALLSLAQQHIPGARLVEELGREAVINLPQMAAKDSSLGVFLSELDQRMTDLGISSYGLSDSTLEEVGAAFFDSPSNAFTIKGRIFFFQGSMFIIKRFKLYFFSQSCIKSFQ